MSTNKKIFDVKMEVEVVSVYGFRTVTMHHRTGGSSISSVSVSLYIKVKRNTIEGTEVVT